MKKIKIKINDKLYCSLPGKTIIEVADLNGIYIPRFCYHKNLSVAANCRMCLVDVKDAKRASPACATPIFNGMEISTYSNKTISFQKKIMEFLLINHPLDCPICDQGGECELQDLSLGYGLDNSKYNESKRTFNNPDLGPLISTEMTRCIQCTRCVRFGEEIAGNKELGAMGRGDNTEITTCVKKTVNSELSGNMIDLCPVGALTSKPYRFLARSWELQQIHSISPVDPIGSNIYVHKKNESIMRIVPKENINLNETWLADRDRFSYIGVDTKDRLKSPCIKENGLWKDISWVNALKHLETTMSRISKNRKKDSFSVIASDNLTTESLYLLQKIFRSLGSNNIDTRVKNGTVYPGVHTGVGLNCSLEEIEKADKVLLVGSFLRKEIPLLNHRVYKAQKNGAEIFSLNSVKYDFNYPVDDIFVHPDKMIYTLSLILNLLSEFDLKKKISSTLLNLIKSLHNSEWELFNYDFVCSIKKLLDKLLQAKSLVIIAGFDIILNNNFGKIFLLLQKIMDYLNAKGGFLSFDANARGALIAGAVPEHGPKFKKNSAFGKNSKEMLSKSFNTDLLMIVDLELSEDITLDEDNLNLFQNTQDIIYLNSYDNPHARKYCSLMLPIGTNFETEGSYVNLLGITQNFNATLKCMHDSKPLWKVLRVLGNYLSLENFNYESTKEILNELNNLKEYPTISPKESILTDINVVKNKFSILRTFFMYSTNSLIRRSIPLQKTEDSKYYSSVVVSYLFAKKYGILESVKSIKISSENLEIFSNVIIDSNIQGETIMVPFRIYPVFLSSNIEIKPLR